MLRFGGSKVTKLYHTLTYPSVRVWYQYVTLATRSPGVA